MACLSWRIPVAFGTNLPALGEKLRDRRVVRRRRYELDAARVHRGIHLLRGDFLALRFLAEDEIPELPRAGEVAHGDADMIDAFHGRDYEQ